MRLACVRPGVRQCVLRCTLVARYCGCVLLRAVECATVHAVCTSIAGDLRWKAPCGGAVQRFGAVTPGLCEARVSRTPEWA
eukprot:9891334-Alexandrium_andersonii.AAC.1